ncbi:TPA: AAA family ATPase [Klebsiella pneumoniae]|uniref:AAA family ATPase n=1 Tax=Klebsiella pneumoniae TaxID=573 RepID=UPI0021D7FF92|nr:AAA family ATPase [Klebsiella pneumoniae]HDU4442144.1 AAA family ATPase [Klebsiella pneumoniae subsp. pneumoniae]MCU8629394.1 AAA family ATPase [Klebsiella pneumoniae]MCU8639745.1 AAA family ATPase [Klebsiella pneumoniae]HBQ7598146.1 AAA family ATPase [Klebsiella pneumoniae]HBQ7630839.1 AAA family ATPase [Klebsiella pneumoniae]
MSEVNITDIREVLRNLAAEKGISFAAIAKEIGLSSGALSGFMNEKYAGDNERVESALSRWIEEQQYASELPETPEFIETQTASQIWTALRYARQMTCISIVCGNPGVGKTEAAREYCLRNDNVWMITASPSSASILECITELAEVLGIDKAPRHKGPLVRTVRRRLSGTKGLIVIDEADHLGMDVLEELRLLQESARVGLVLMGNHNVYSNMTGVSRTVEFARLFSRIAKRVAINKTKKADVSAVAEAWHITSEEERTLLQEIAAKPGALRTLSHTLRLAAMTAHGAKKPLNEAFIRKAYSDLNLDVDVSKLLRG